MSVAANIGFPALLAWQLAPRLFGSAKKWRNQALPIVLAAICGCAVAFTVVPRAIAASGALQRPPYPLLIVAVSLFALLLLFMGGRLIAPSVAGQLHRQGIDLDARVQPRIEARLSS